MGNLPELIDPKKILSGDRLHLQQLLEVSVEAVNSSNAILLEREELISRLHVLQDKCAGRKLNLLNLLTPELPPSTEINPADQRVLKLIDLLFNSFNRVGKLDPKILEQILRLRIVIAKLALLDDNFLVSASHFGQQFINDISEYSIGWYEGLGAAGDGYLQELELTITNVCTWFERDTRVILGAQSALKQFLVRDAARAQKLSERNCDGEVGKVKEQYARVVATGFLNRATNSCQLPDAAIEFLQGRWLLTLKLACLNFGQDSEEWEGRKQLTKQLIESLQPTKTEGQRAKQFELISTIYDDIAAALLPPDVDVSTEAQLDAISEAHFLMLRSKSIPVSVVEAMDNPDAVNGKESVESIALLGEVLGFSEGQWLMVQMPGDETDAQWVRCRMARKIEGINQLLFLNRQGQKIMSKGLGELATSIAQKNAKAIKPQRLFAVTYRALLKQLSNKYSAARSG